MPAGHHPVDGVRAGLVEGELRGVTGPVVTPLILAVRRAATRGRSLPTDLALVADDEAAAASSAPAPIGDGG